MAILVDRFHLSLEQIGNLTDRCLFQVYFHPRDKDGSIKLPDMFLVESDPLPEEEEPAASLEKITNQLQMFLGMGVIDQANYDQCITEAKVKYGSAVNDNDGH